MSPVPPSAPPRIRRSPNGMGAGPDQSAAPTCALMRAAVGEHARRARHPLQAEVRGPQEQGHEPGPRMRRPPRRLDGTQAHPRLRAGARCCLPLQYAPGGTNVPLGARQGANLSVGEVRQDAHHHSPPAGHSRASLERPLTHQRALEQVSAHAQPPRSQGSQCRYPKLRAPHSLHERSYATRRQDLVRRPRPHPPPGANFSDGSTLLTYHQALGKIPAASAILIASPIRNGVSPLLIASPAPTWSAAASQLTPSA